MIAEGRLHVDLRWDGAAVNAVEIRSSRSPEVAAALRGLPVSEAIARVPLLFSICGRAQAVAAVSAAEQALGLRARDRALARRAWLVQAEAAQEYLWRLAVDIVPEGRERDGALTRLAPLRREFAAALGSMCEDGEWLRPGGQPGRLTLSERGRIAEALADYLDMQVLGMPVTRWSKIASAAEFLDWVKLARTPVGEGLRRLARMRFPDSTPIELMDPARNRELVLEVLPRLEAEPRFAARPEHGGQPLETGALARCARRPLIRELLQGGTSRPLARMAARLTELADAVGLLAREPSGKECGRWLGATATGTLAGAAWVETARGLLVHALRLEGERMRSYRILAPTEWNFHPLGALASALLAAPARTAAELEERARVAVLALDPCVGFEIEVSHA